MVDPLNDDTITMFKMFGLLKCNSVLNIVMPLMCHTVTVPNMETVHVTVVFLVKSLSYDSVLPCRASMSMSW